MLQMLSFSSASFSCRRNAEASDMESCSNSRLGRGNHATQAKASMFYDYLFDRYRLSNALQTPKA